MCLAEYALLYARVNLAQVGKNVVNLIVDATHQSVSATNGNNITYTRIPVFDLGLDPEDSTSGQDIST